MNVKMLFLFRNMLSSCITKNLSVSRKNFNQMFFSYVTVPNLCGLITQDAVLAMFYLIKTIRDGTKQFCRNSDQTLYMKLPTCYYRIAAGNKYDILKKQNK